MEEAKNKFEEGLLEANRISSRKILWQLNYYLGLWYREQGENNEADSCFKQANEIIRYISDHIEDTRLKEKFFARDEVQDLQRIPQN
jgi:hypothetical protein